MDLNYGRRKFWDLIANDFTDSSWSIFLMNMSDLKNKMFILMTDLKIAGIDVKFIHCDDSGENQFFYDSCRANGHNIKFEFSSPRTPQRNCKVERKFKPSMGGLEQH
jgi:hypothetical protein